MSPQHLSDDELIEMLYGGREPSGHAAGCGECRARLEELEKRRLAAAAPPEISPAFLHAQRQRVFERADRYARQASFRWAASLAASAAVFLGLVLSTPVPKPQPAVPVQSDAQLFSDINALLATPEPVAAAPIRNLFEE
jgi:anti-sigma factor RsiW